MIDEIKIFLAHQLLESMDTTADPCNNFYQFACGGWLKKYNIPDSSTRWGQFDFVRQRVGDQLRGRYCPYVHQLIDLLIILYNIDVLKKPNSEDDPRPIKEARDMYAACINTGTQHFRFLTHFV